MLRRAFLFAALASLGCSSSDFDVGGNDAGTTGDTDTSTETTDGAPPGPCDKEPGKAKYCITVKLAKPDHPPYTTASGAVGLNLDGSGRVYIAMWDTDPTAVPPGSPTPEPRIVVPYPSESGEINIDTGLPVTISGTAPPANYTVMALFADNLTTTRPAGDALPGDFVLLPTVSAGKLAFPKMNVAMDDVQQLTLELRPNRKVSVTLGFDSTFLTYAKTQPTVHGDGPTMFAMFDGELKADTTFLGLDFGSCVNTKIQTTPTAKIINFTTTVEGDHNAFAAIFDYEAEPNFPGKGTLTSSPAAPYPVVSIKSDLWTANATIDLKDIHLGAHPTPGPVDKLTCP